MDEIACQDYTTSWNRMYNEHIERDDVCAVVTNYDSYAQSYEKDCATLRFSLPNVVTQLLMDHMPESLFGSETVAILDVAAGGCACVSAVIQNLDFCMLDRTFFV